MPAPLGHDRTGVSLDDETRLLIYNPVIVVVSQAVFFAVVFLLWLFFRPVVPSDTMGWWVGLVFVLLAGVVTFDLAFIVRRADSRRLMRFWSLIEKRQTVAFDLVAISVIWLFLPYGDEWHRLVVGCLCIGHVPLQMISDPENVSGNQFSMVAVLGSFAAYLAGNAYQTGNTALAVLVALIVLYGALLYYASGVFRIVVVNALRDRRAAEAAKAMLEAALGEVSAERDARTRFIAAAAHDLGQPMQAARLFAEQAQATDDPDRRTQTLAKAVSTIGSAQDMLGGMLYHMRLEADAVEPILRPLDLSEVLSQVVERFQPQAQAAGVVLALRSPPATIHSDKVLIDRALGNLIHNALVHSGSRRIFVYSYRCADGMAIIVSDKGAGIAPCDEADLFTDYRQGQHSASVLRGGFGLGLGSVRRVAALLGGRADYIRRRRGAAFRIVLSGSAAAA